MDENAPLMFPLLNSTFRIQKAVENETLGYPYHAEPNHDGTPNVGVYYDPPAGSVTYPTWEWTAGNYILATPW